MVQIHHLFSQNLPQVRGTSSSGHRSCELEIDKLPYIAITPAQFELLHGDTFLRKSHGGPDPEKSHEEQNREQVISALEYWHNLLQLWEQKVTSSN